MTLANRINPTVTELAAREKALREEILGSGRAIIPPVPQVTRTRISNFDGLGREVALTDGEPNVGSTLTATVLDPESAEILFINLISRRVVTTMGEFNLNDVETAQIAFVALNSVGRNLQDVVMALGTKYDIPALQQRVAEQTQRTVDELRAQETVRMTGQTKPTNSLAVAEADEIDEENDLPPIPTNRRRPKRN